ncbi:Hypothetical protein SRAE_2000189700 [Strongyloides ratti]|uniref:DUF7778 domain-containing protein n=1 Tax=Strongyloides ratti TaxID=34506 RepID=A0A090LGK4_STRRB|nr:Hypothetical protein SRAE_2000189700 [Strongyloides ratti]CEF67233.1 Hypothetical protein SRAE_2000189700 [Strongyloides ratti]
METLQIPSNNKSDINIEDKINIGQNNQNKIDIFNDTDCNMENDFDKDYKENTQDNEKLKKNVDIFGVKYKESKTLNKKVPLPPWNQLISDRRDVVAIGKINVKEYSNFLRNFVKSASSRRCCIIETGHLLIYSSTSEDKGYLLDLKKMEKIVFEGYASSIKNNGKLVAIKLKWSFGSVTITLSEDEISEWKEPIFVIHENSEIYELTKKFNWTHRRKPTFNTTLNEEIDAYYNDIMEQNDADDEIEYDENKYIKQLEFIHPSRGQLNIHEDLKKLINNSSMISGDGSRYDTPRPDRKLEKKMMVGDYED